METNKMYYEDEISLKELMLIVWNGKKIIAGITALAIILAAIISYTVLDKTYESRTILLVSNASAKPVSINGSTGVEGLVDTLSGNIPQTITTYKEQMLTTEMIRNVLEHLGFEDEYSVSNLRSMINVTNISDTNLLSVTVTAKDPQRAADIANTLASEFSEFVANMNTQRLSKSSAFLQQKVQEEKAKLDSALEVYKEFLAQSPGTSEIQAEISAKSSRMNNLKSELNELDAAYTRDLLVVENDLKIKRSEVSNIQALLKNTEPLIVQKQSVLQDSSVSGLAQASGQTPEQLAGMTLENEVVNPNYISLQSRLDMAKIDLNTLKQKKINIETTFEVTKELLNTEISKLSSSLEELNVAYAEKSNAEKLITKDVQRAESSYDQFVKSYEDTRVAESADIGKSTILINSSAVPNDRPVGPKSVLNMAIAAVLGMMLSVFYVFMKHYWNITDLK